jgi:hypothetical protein
MESNETIQIKKILVTKHALGEEVSVPSGWQPVPEATRVVAVERKPGDAPAPVELNRNQHNRRMRVWLHEDSSRKMEDFIDAETGATTDKNGFGTLPPEARLPNKNFVDETVYLTWVKS